MVPNSQERDPVSFRATYIFACHFSLGYRLLLFRNFQLFTTMYASYTENWQGNIIVFPFSIAKLGLLPLSPFPAKFDTTIWIIGVRTSGPALWCVGGRGMWKLPRACLSRWIGNFSRQMATSGVCRWCKIRRSTCITFGRQALMRIA